MLLGDEDESVYISHCSGESSPLICFCDCPDAQTVIQI